MRSCLNREGESRTKKYRTRDAFGMTNLVVLAPFSRLYKVFLEQKLHLGHQQVDVVAGAPFLLSLGCKTRPCAGQALFALSRREWHTDHNSILRQWYWVVHNVYTF